MAYGEIFDGSLKADGDLHDHAKLDRSQLDYSLQSLREVDQYLLHLHKKFYERIPPALKPTLLCCGGYTGEVVRRHAKRQFTWVDFEEYLRRYPASFDKFGAEKNIGFFTLLVYGDGLFIMPINKVVMFITRGPDESFWYYASREIKRKALDGDGQDVMFSSISSTRRPRIFDRR